MNGSMQPASMPAVHPALHRTHTRRGYHLAAWDSSGVPPPPRVRPNRRLLDEATVHLQAIVPWWQPRSKQSSSRVMRGGLGAMPHP